MKNALLISSMVLLSGCGCEQINAGHRGIETRFGEVQGKPLTEGLHFYNPITSTIKEIKVQEEKIEGKAVSFTRDTQRVEIDFAVTLYPDPEAIEKIYKEYGEAWEAKLVPQAIQNSIKDVVGQYIADDLVGKRDEARGKAEGEVIEILKTRNVLVTRLDFVNLDFDDKYETAVEAKVVAVQRSAEAINKTVEIQEQAKQRVIQAKSEAEAMTIKSEALSKNKGLVEYEAIIAWNGQLPLIMSSSGGGNILSIPDAILKTDHKPRGFREEKAK